MVDGAGQTATPDQQAFAQQWINAYKAGLQQPQAQLQETQAGAAAAGASAERTAQETAIAQRTQQQQQFTSDTQNLFDKAKQNGYIDPLTYNTQKSKAASIGIDGKTFDSLYESNYVDPTQQWKYNTDTGRSFLNQRNQIVSSISSQVNDLVNNFGKGFAGGGNNILSGLAVQRQAQGGLIQGAETGIGNLPSELLSALGITGGAETLYEQGRQNFSDTLKELSKAAQTPGLGLNPSEVEQISKNIPAAGDNYGTLKNKLTALNDQITQLTGKSLDPSVLQKYGVNEKPMTGGDLLQGLIKNAGTDLASQMQGVSQEQQQTGGGIGGAAVATLEGIPGLAKGVAQIGGDVLQKGPLAAILGAAYQHPLTATETVLPFLAKGLGAGEATTGGATGGIDSITKPSAPLRTINTLSDFLKGGGTKENVLMASKYGNEITQNQVMNELGVNTHPTETGQLQAMQTGLDNYGKSLANIYNNSKEVITGNNLSSKLLDKLQGNGVPADEANKIVGKVTADMKDQGFFDLAKQDTVISAKQLWQGAKWLEKYKPNIPGDPNASAYLKQNAGFMSSIMRSELADRVPDSRPYAARYGILKNAIENAKDPTGLNIRNGIVRSILSAGVNTAETIPAKLYQILGGKPLPNIAAETPQTFTQGAVQNPQPFQTGPLQGGESATMTPTKLIRDLRTKQGNPKFRGQ